jgi:Protein of unknown function (DUF3237)
MSAAGPELVHEFTYTVACGAQHDAGNGPYGSRQCYEMVDGVIVGKRLNGVFIDPAADWMLVGPDGVMRMDVRFQLRTDDGAVILVHYFGPAEANATLIKAVQTFAPTEFADHVIRAHWVLETGDPRYAWVNQTIFVSEGRLQPPSHDQLGFEHLVYRVG